MLVIFSYIILHHIILAVNLDKGKSKGKNQNIIRWTNCCNVKIRQTFWYRKPICLPDILFANLFDYFVNPSGDGFGFFKHLDFLIFVHTCNQRKNMLYYLSFCFWANPLNISVFSFLLFISWILASTISYFLPNLGYIEVLYSWTNNILTSISIHPQ